MRWDMNKRFRNLRGDWIESWALASKPAFEMLDKKLIIFKIEFEI